MMVVTSVTPRGGSPKGCAVGVMRLVKSMSGGGHTLTGVVMIETPTPPVTMEPTSGGESVGGRRPSSGMLPQPRASPSGE